MTESKINNVEIRFTSRELEEIKHVLDSGILREGPYSEKLETRVKELGGAEHAVACSSGTAALHLCALALLKPGDEVLVPSFTFIATASVCALVGARPVFCDVDPETWTVTVAELKKRVTPKTRAIIGVHLFGNACEIEAIERFACENNLDVIWDAAQSFGARFKNKDVAAYGRATCFSFYPTKNLTTGEGGLITTQDAELAAKLRALKNHGEAGRYHHTLVGLNARMSELGAAIGSVQLEAFPERLARRREIAERYLKGFESIPGFTVQKVTPAGEHAYNYFSVLVNPDKIKISRDEVIKQLADQGIGCSVHYPVPLHEQPCFEPFRSGSLSVAEDLTRRIFSLPMHPFLKDAEVDRVLEALRSF